MFNGSLSQRPVLWILSLERPDAVTRQPENIPMRCFIHAVRNGSLSVLVIACLSVGTASAQTPRAAAAPRTADVNSVLLAAASPFEDMTEFALQGNQAGIDRALKAYSADAARVDRALSAGARTQLHARTAAIAKARRASDNPGVAINAVEAYGILVQGLHPARLKVPVEVANLDYAGFKLKVLMHGASKDWASARAVSRKANADWSAIRARVTDKGLQDAMAVTMDGMRQATAKGNGGMAALAADVDLALVDLLETYFESARK